MSWSIWLKSAQAAVMPAFVAQRVDIRAIVRSWEESLAAFPHPGPLVLIHRDLLPETSWEERASLRLLSTGVCSARAIPPST